MRRSGGPSKAERKANDIAGRLLNVLAEIELYMEDDPGMIFEAATFMTTKKTDLLSPVQLSEVRKQVKLLEQMGEDSE